ncbi:MAG: cobyrinate a,c-diamide synthase [Spirochaetes bacterium]|nr:cobyrinate a,c-diamide synthase [Spirochaetota bacterium]
MKGIIIAAPHSGSGKTLFSIGLMKTLTNQGYEVVPFKVGPDYIDPMFHHIAINQKSSNLDSYMLDDQTIKQLFSKKMKKNSMAVIEGVMGFYDGYAYSVKASTYDIARILQIPTILIINAQGASVSLLAQIAGFLNYQKGNQIKGIILNQIKNLHHYEAMKSKIEEELSVECLGYLPPMANVNFYSRHLGLIQPAEIPQIQSMINKIAKTIEDTVNIDRLVALSDIKTAKVDNDSPVNKKQLRIGIAFDQAFSFYYQENLDFLQDNNFELVFFSPLSDPELPKQLDALYLGGGYPEVFAEPLQQNHSLKKEIRTKLEKGFPCFAECGGLIYLAKNVITDQKYQMVGFFDFEIELTDKLQHFGYEEVELAGATTFAHEFHYTRIKESSLANTNYEFKYSVKKRNKSWQEGYSRKNVIAGYPHIHFLSNQQFSLKIIELFKKGKSQ